MRSRSGLGKKGASSNNDRQIGQYIRRSESTEKYMYIQNEMILVTLQELLDFVSVGNLLSTNEPILADRTGPAFVRIAISVFLVLGRRFCSNKIQPPATSNDAGLDLKDVNDLSTQALNLLQKVLQYDLLFYKKLVSFRIQTRLIANSTAG